MAKRKVTVTLDEDLLDALDRMGSDNVSAVVNEALRSRVEAMAHHEALGELLASWQAAYKAPSQKARAAAKAAFDELDGLETSQVA
jgi:metal-responsive CopG/Arc/MetJ family transcriptional regulator